MTTKFRKKPVEIEAVQWTAADDAYSLIEWADASVDYDPHTSGPSDPQTGDDWGRLAVTTLEGEHVATPRDWLIKGVKGEFYFCKPDVFEATYEPVGRQGCGPDCSEQHTYGAGCAIKPPARAFLGEQPCGKPGCPCGGAA